TNRQTDNGGFESISKLTATFADLNLGLSTDTFDVNNGIGVAVTPDGAWAFVTGFDQFVPGIPTHDPNSAPFTRGGNIGINKAPLGIHGPPQLVAGTVMVPNSFPDNLVLSPDGTQLLAAYRQGLDHGIYVYDVAKLIQTVQNASPATLATTPLDQLNPSVF